MQIAYLVSRFPNPSQTFVMDEIASHVRHGLDVRVIALRRGQKCEELSASEALVAERVHDAGLANSAPARLCQVAGQAARDMLGGRECLKIFNPLDRNYPVYRPGIFSLARRWNEFALDPDVLHCHFGPMGLFGAALKTLGLTRARLVTTFHGFDMSTFPARKGAGVYGPLFRQGDLLLTVSGRWRERLIQLGGPPERTHVHRIGVDLGRIPFRVRCRPANGPIRIVTVGRLVEKKGHEVTLRALALLKERRPDLPLSLDLIGAGPLEARLRRQADELGVAETVTFHGGTSHELVLEILERGMIFVLPSITSRDGDQEGIPVSLMEAMAGGMPVISTRHSGIPELIEDGISGILCAEGDHEDLARALAGIIDAPGRWDEMGRAGRSRVEAEFNQQAQHDRLRQSYSDLMA